jgi:hypothetical protein
LLGDDVAAQPLKRKAAHTSIIPYRVRRLMLYIFSILAIAAACANEVSGYGFLN